MATNDGRSRVRRLNWRINGDGVKCLAGRCCGRKCKFDGIGRLTPETSALFTGFRHNRKARQNGQRFPSTRRVGLRSTRTIARRSSLLPSSTRAIAPPLHGGWNGGSRGNPIVKGIGRRGSSCGRARRPHGNERPSAGWCAINAGHGTEATAHTGRSPRSPQRFGRRAGGRHPSMRVRGSENRTGVPAGGRPPRFLPVRGPQRGRRRATHQREYHAQARAVRPVTLSGVDPCGDGRFGEGYQDLCVVDLKPSSGVGVPGPHAGARYALRRTPMTSLPSPVASE